MRGKNTKTENRFLSQNQRSHNPSDLSGVPVDNYYYYLLNYLIPFVIYIVYMR